MEIFTLALSVLTELRCIEHSPIMNKRLLSRDSTLTQYRSEDLMFWNRKKKIEWPKATFEEIKKRARLLVIDDIAFAYLDLFKRDGYAIDHWRDVEDLTKLENGAYDIILLDVQGVGKAISPTEQGLGVLHHLRQVAPAQLVIAFSSSDFSLKYQDFFRLADATLPKSADYVDFKRQVDDLLRDRVSLGFYVSKVIGITNPPPQDQAKFQKEATEAILTREPGKLGKFLTEKLITKDNIDIAVKMVKMAIEVHDKWK
ncbi:MAG TPA: response regulator [Acidobacteriaceae bacterium]|jgi:CheY-like chemotaxis protein